MQALNAFLRWFGQKPNLNTQEDVREFLEVMVDGWASSLHLLTPAQRERIESPGFLEYLRMILGARFLKLTAALRG